MSQYVCPAIRMTDGYDSEYRTVVSVSLVAFFELRPSYEVPVLPSQG